MQIAYSMEMHVMGYNSYTIALLGITKVRVRIQVQVPVSLAGRGEWVVAWARHGSRGTHCSLILATMDEAVAVRHLRV